MKDLPNDPIHHPRKRSGSYDPDCGTLAERFLADAARTGERPRTAGDAADLAQDIQGAIEDWFMVEAMLSKADATE